MKDLCGRLMQVQVFIEKNANKTSQAQNGQRAKTMHTLITKSKQGEMWQHMTKHCQ